MFHMRRIWMTVRKLNDSLEHMKEKALSCARCQIHWLHRWCSRRRAVFSSLKSSVIYWWWSGDAVVRWIISQVVKWNNEQFISSEQGNSMCTVVSQLKEKQVQANYSSLHRHHMWRVMVVNIFDTNDSCITCQRSVQWWVLELVVSLSLKKNHEPSGQLMYFCWSISCCFHIESQRDWRKPLTREFVLCVCLFSQWWERAACWWWWWWCATGHRWSEWNGRRKIIVTSLVEHSGWRGRFTLATSVTNFERERILKESYSLLHSDKKSVIWLWVKSISRSTIKSNWRVFLCFSPLIRYNWDVM